VTRLCAEGAILLDQPKREGETLRIGASAKQRHNLQTKRGGTGRRNAPTAVRLISWIAKPKLFQFARPASALYYLNPNAAGIAGTTEQLARMADARQSFIHLVNTGPATWVASVQSRSAQHRFIPPAQAATKPRLPDLIASLVGVASPKRRQWTALNIYWQIGRDQGLPAPSVRYQPNLSQSSGLWPILWLPAASKRRASRAGIPSRCLPLSGCSRPDPTPAKLL
jgi:hypothetical protein